MKTFWNIIYFFAALFMLLFLIMFGLFWFDDVGNCKSDGNVWDDDKKVCREDCLYWSDTKGCVQLTDEELTAFKNCKYKSNDCYSSIYAKMFPKKCLDYGGAYNLDDETCEFEFTAENCYKLSGNWKYPRVCERQLISR